MAEQLRWTLSPLEAAYVGAVTALWKRCEAEAAPHRARAESTMAPARTEVNELLVQMAKVRGVPPESLRTYFEIDGNHLVVELAQATPVKSEGAS